MPDDAKIEGARLKQVLDSALRLFGDAGRQYIMDDLAAHGIRFEKDVFYNLSDVQKALYPGRGWRVARHRVGPR